MSHRRAFPVTGEVVMGRSVMEFVSPDRIVESGYEVRGGQEVRDDGAHLHP